jgi:hypothetical protein
MLNNTSHIPLRYDIQEEAICIIIFLLILGIEIFISIVQILGNCMKMRKKVNINDLIRSLYKQQMDTPSTTTKTHSSIEQTMNEGAFLSLDKPTATISEETTEF